MPAAFTQPGARLLVESCIFSTFVTSATCMKMSIWDYLPTSLRWVYTCKVGGGSNLHISLQNRNRCLPNHLEGKHKCIEDISHKIYPICLEDIRTQIKKTKRDSALWSSYSQDFLREAGRVWPPQAHNCPVCVHSLAYSLSRKRV